jgi:hypothetical protein
LTSTVRLAASVVGRDLDDRRRHRVVEHVELDVEPRADGDVADQRLGDRRLEAERRRIFDHAQRLARQAHVAGVDPLGGDDAGDRRAHRRVARHGLGLGQAGGGDAVARRQRVVLGAGDRALRHQLAAALELELGVGQRLARLIDPGRQLADRQPRDDVAGRDPLADHAAQLGDLAHHAGRDLDALLRAHRADRVDAAHRGLGAGRLRLHGDRRQRGRRDGAGFIMAGGERQERTTEDDEARYAGHRARMSRRSRKGFGAPAPPRIPTESRRL